MRFLIIVFMLFVFGCNEKKTEIVIPEVKKVEVEKKEVSLSEISAIAEKSSCAKYSWKNRGLAPKAFIKGMAISYVREICFPSKAVNSPLKISDIDSLAHYKLQASPLNLYTLMIGAGMRESSGKWCCGRDGSASNTSSDTAEAGIFQTSFNARSSSPELVTLFKDYKENPHNCISEFKEGITCNSGNLANYGSGDGFTFQKLSKDCPAFGVQFAAIVMRNLKNHYGPIKRKEVEFKKECSDMLKEVEKKITPEVCAKLK